MAGFWICHRRYCRVKHTKILEETELRFERYCVLYICAECWGKQQVMLFCEMVLNKLLISVGLEFWIWFSWHIIVEHIKIWDKSSEWFRSYDFSKLREGSVLLSGCWIFRNCVDLSSLSILFDALEIRSTVQFLRCCLVPCIG